MKSVGAALVFIVGCALAATPRVGSCQGVPRDIDTSKFGKPGADCAELRYVDFSTVDEAITQVVEALPMSGQNGVPAYCQVEGYVWRQTRFRLRFPLEGWNGKLLVQGGGGQDGWLPDDVPSTGRNAPFLQQGYATVNHDGGHVSTVADAKWSFQNESAVIDFGFRAPHVTTVASKAILNHFFGHAPVRSYYNGCSNGGREALMMAQRFPWDFDGIVVGAPSLAMRDLFINMYWMSELLRDQSRSGLDAAAARTLHAGVLAQCDKLDGKADGVIDEPRRCKVDFKPMLCKAEPNEACLTAHQVEIARQIYEGARTPEGKQIAASSAFPGSELSWDQFATPRWAIGYAQDYLRYSAFSPPPGPGWNPDPSRIGDYYKRMGVTEALTSPLNPDLRAFKANGGKVLAYYGWTDGFGGARAVMDYYDMAERIAGGEDRMQEFFRLFMIPGMDHCAGGVGASVFDFVGVLDNWVQHGVAPQSIAGYHPGPDGKPQFFRTVTPYRSTPVTTQVK